MAVKKVLAPVWKPRFKIAILDWTVTEQKNSAYPDKHHCGKWYIKQSQAEENHSTNAK